MINNKILNNNKKEIPNRQQLNIHNLKQVIKYWLNKHTKMDGG